MLALSSDSVRVLIEVWDAEPEAPAPKDLGEHGTPDPQEEGGRGLFLVAALSARFYRPTTSSWSSSVNSVIMLANWPAIRSR